MFQISPERPGALVSDGRWGPRLSQIASQTRASRSYSDHGIRPVKVCGASVQVDGTENRTDLDHHHCKGIDVDSLVWRQVLGSKPFRVQHLGRRPSVGFVEVFLTLTGIERLV